MNREFDLVLFGATGFTGRLVAEYLSRAADKPRWAIAGRDRTRLETLGFGVPVLVADALDASQVADLAQKARVVCTTIGPYTRYGSELVRACAEAGTHYCDLAGEVAWMRRMIDAHHERARATGARIVHACGFDSVPSDLGTWAVQQEAVAAVGKPANSVTALFGRTRGGLSGGTLASGLEAAVEASRDRTARRVLADPYALDPVPHDERPAAPDVTSVRWDSRLGVWTAPFLMAEINTRVVRRSHALAGFPWGRDFVYREAMSAPGSARGLALALGMAGGLATLAFAKNRPRLLRELVRRGPKPGTGPSPETRARGRWEVRFVAEAGDRRLLYVAGDEHGDPGYTSTAKMLGESALCLALDGLTSAGGVTTPSLAMGGTLLERLRRAGLTFRVAR